jgi:NADPH2 dehydrogenase
VEGKADCVLMAREMLREPYWAWKAGKELGDGRVRLPEQYARAVG